MPGLKPDLPTDWPGALAPGLFVFLWSTGFIVARYGLPHAGPLSFLFVRFLVVIGLMLLLALATRAPWPRGARLWLRIGIAGLLIHAIHLCGVYLAIAYRLPLGVISAIVGLQPVLTAIGAAVLLGERVRGRQWFGLMLGLIGATVIVMTGVQGGFDLAGLPAAFGALLGITAGTLYQKRFCPSFDYRSGAVIQYVPAALVTALALMVFEEFNVQWNASFAFSLVWLTLVLSFGAVGLLNYLIRTGSATSVASLFYLVPPATAVIAWLVFDESLSGSVIGGIALAACGVYLALTQTEKHGNYAR